ncbi:carbamoyl-phosphate synthase (glutamine-hydrolyzing) large subunit [Thermoplasma sp.]|uniref:carbamoyl-phosphate synthase (glutamine-hydrolyzing) large subunit n=1 Tax=Thermoplasma sp. TaxID=1973142 RepID=UPI0012772F04|nr:carbamoyl-phosphate synthase (glutamine-hydrolyzing) large subunit [Thermoplasma sp.]KAA8922212.1 MAG: carbamoyl-phosphate synthase (glutamine-hydrolyzing) large subunit [Thermoplasma sp.]
MPRRDDVHRILVIGSGPVVIGQAAEFDYSGSQACLSLREEGYFVVLLNSNPATIQTDHRIADRVYIEPITVEAVERIIARENIDAIEPHMGGQTALNLAVKLKKSGVLDRYGIKIIGTPVESIELAEDREKFYEFLKTMGEPQPARYKIRRDNIEEDIASIPDSPVIVRTSFSLGGTGGSIARSRQDLKNMAENLFRSSDIDYLEVNESLEGMKEIEYEVIRDSFGNCITVCNMENIDPMGVHTGESIVVTPSQTLSDVEYQMLRDSAIRIISGLGIQGACNIQFALSEGRYYIIEVNPRTSRSSALASKATGYPIARIAAKIAAGYGLHEIRNPITKSTYAAYEPSLDYVTVKIPRWPFDKFSVDRTIGVQMKSIGEVMGIGRTFEEAIMKAIASLDNAFSSNIRMHASDEELWKLIERPNDRRLFAIFEGLFRNFDTKKMARLSGYDEYFIEKMENIVEMLKHVEIGHIPENLLHLKRIGIPDEIISSFCGIPADAITKYRIEKNIMPVYKRIDTCSGEFEVVVPYMYSTYEDEDEMPDLKGSIMIIGSGPNRIAQGLEFDYGSVKAILALRDMGYRSIMLNSNPETVSTDFDVSDALFFEPVTPEYVINVINRSGCAGLIVQFSGQTGQNMAKRIEDILGRRIVLGTSTESIERIEDRTVFSKVIEDLGIKQPPFAIAENENDTVRKAVSLGLPIILRSSHVIGGRSMEIIYDMDYLADRAREVFTISKNVLVSKYLENATEMDVDFVSDGSSYNICGILVHIEEAGVHSGDATMVYGPGMVSREVEEKIENIVESMVKEFHLIGLSNLQIAARDDDVYVIELNARSSRSVPFISKATGVDWVRYAVECMMGSKITEKRTEAKSYFIKVSVFPFSKFSDMDVVYGPEMKSTGEAMYPGRTITEALRKSLQRSIRSVLITVRDEDKPRMVDIARIMLDKGIKIYATAGTARYLNDHGISAETLYRVRDRREPRILDMISGGAIDMVINTTEMTAGAVRDGFKIRRMCIMRGIPLIMNVNLAKAYAESLGPIPIDYREIGEYL